MKVDRHNYEEFFILYWDNELTASQKLAVENFVKENTDLQEEFRVFGETRFSADDAIRIEEKEFLLNDSFVNITNYEEQLLNYIDDELTAGQKKEVEKIAAQYLTVQKELVLLQKTKLQPEEEVVFHDKSVLYRREEKPDSYQHRLISMTWYRVAAAAAIILIAGLVTLKLVNNKSVESGTVVKGIDVKNIPATNQTQNIKQTNPSTEMVNAEIKKPKTIQNDDKITRNPAGQKPINDPTDNLVAAYKPENKNNLPKERNIPDQTVNDKHSTEVVAEAVIPDLEKKNFNSPEKNNNDAINTGFDKSDVTLNAKPALYIPETSEKEKGGLKEFLRKTTRVFERRTKIQTTTDDNKLLVGVFAVSLK